MARKIEVDLTSDTSDFEKGMDGAAKAVDRLDKKLDDAAHGSKSFDDGLEKVSGGLEGATGKFRSTADLAGGLGDVMGIQALGPMAQYATGFADIADGLGGLLAPALAKAKTAFMAMNATLLANPIFLVIAALTALTVGFVIAYKKSETFRNIVNGAMDGVKSAVQSMWHAVSPIIDLWKLEFKILGKAVELAADAIKGAWNHTLGGKGISIPGVHLPGFLGGGGFDGFSFNIPYLAAGGNLAGGQAAIVGERGPELFVPHGSGTVIPNGKLGGGVTVIINTGASDLDELIRKRVRILSGGNVQKAFGY